MRCLLRDVVSFRIIRVLPITCENFAQYWIEWLLHSPTAMLAGFLMVMLALTEALCASRSGKT